MDYLLPISNRAALVWVVSEQRTALPSGRVAEAGLIRRRDRLFLYTTRGCFRNPTRDRGRVISTARVTAPAQELSEPIVFGGRTYQIGLWFRIERLAAVREGVELGPLVSQLATFPNPDAWSARLRRSLVPLAGDDGDVLQHAVAKIAPPYPAALPTYLALG